MAGDNEFIVKYAAYHHFRANKWVVKSGLKYGTDFGKILFTMIINLAPTLNAYVDVTT